MMNYVLKFIFLISLISINSYSYANMPVEYKLEDFEVVPTTGCGGLIFKDALINSNNDHSRGFFNGGAIRLVGDLSTFPPTFKTNRRNGSMGIVFKKLRSSVNDNIILYSGEMRFWNDGNLDTSTCSISFQLTSNKIPKDVESDRNNFNISLARDNEICFNATFNGNWATNKNKQKYVDEAKHRNLDCGVLNDNLISVNVASKEYKLEDFEVVPTTGCGGLIFKDALINSNNDHSRGFFNGGAIRLVGDLSTFPPTFKTNRRNGSMGIVFKKLRSSVNDNIILYSGEMRFWNDGNLDTSTCSISFQLTSNKIPKDVESASTELLAAQQEAEVLKERLAELEAQQSQTQRATSADTQIPLITITHADAHDMQGMVAGRVSDNVGVAEVTVDGNVVPVTSNGSFEYSTYVPASGLNVVVEVTNLAGLSSSQTVILERNVKFSSVSISFDRLNPIATPVKPNRNALALIIGVSDYRNTHAKAIYADIDAMVFHDYASEKLGIPDNRIKTLVNDGADIREFLLSAQNWLSRSIQQNETDVYVFFAGHGLASDDGEQMYLLPYDGSPELLDKTAILRDELFSDIASANPRSVTVFLDTCYSGSTRGSEMLVAARPILLKAKESAVPEGFTVFTAAAGDETAKPLEEAKHGMFSYFLMKGMEGDADTNGDKQITAGELHTYVKSNVVQQSSGTQTPELQGDADRVLVRFQ